MSADPMSPAELDEIRETAERMVRFIAEHGMAAIEATVTDAPLHVLTLRRLLATIDASVVCERNTFQSLRYAEMARDKALEKEAEVTQERDDARLALAMARGEEWPKGWSWKEGHLWWESPCGLYYITPVAMCRNQKRGGWKLDWHRDRDAAHDPYGSTELRRGILHPDALAALRAYQALVAL